MPLEKTYNILCEVSFSIGGVWETAVYQEGFKLLLI